jgi:hypothetical protein
MLSATHARTVADRCRKATSEAPGSLVRGTVRISTSKPALFWGHQRRRAFQVTMSWSKAMTSKWKYRISIRTIILSLSYFVFPFVKPDRAPATPWPEFWRRGIGPVILAVVLQIGVEGQGRSSLYKKLSEEQTNAQALVIGVYSVKASDVLK